MIEQLILVRHGETLKNVEGIAQGWSDSELSPRGVQQVSRLAERLAGAECDALYSSPLGRAASTAQHISNATGLEVRTLDDLREMNYGTWEGQSFLDVRVSDAENFKRWSTETDFACPTGESHSAVFERMKRALDSLLEHRRPIVVSHGTAIRIAVTALLGLPLSAARHFAQDNASCNLFLRRPHGWVLKVWNDTSHCSAES